MINSIHTARYTAARVQYAMVEGIDNILLCSMILRSFVVEKIKKSVRCCCGRAAATRVIYRSRGCPGAIMGKCSSANQWHYLRATVVAARSDTATVQ